MDFAEMKKKRGEMAGSLEKFQEERESKGKKDDTVYFPKTDANGNAFVTVRWLPQKDMLKHPIQTTFKHKATLEGKNISLLCPSTFGSMKDCELCQIAAVEWKRQKDNGEKFPKVPEYRNKTRLINLLVVKDKAQPECVGRVMKMYLADDLVKKIESKLFPIKDSDGQPVRDPDMIHDLWTGKNFNIVITRDKNGYNDFSESSFEAECTPVAKTEAEIEAIFNQLHEIEADRKLLLTSDEIVEKWNTFFALNHGETLDEKSKKAKEEDKKAADTKAKEKEAEKEAEKDFSNSGIEQASNMDNEDGSANDEEELPWETKN